VPEAPGVGDVTDSVTLEPESNQPVIGVGESYGEVTVRRYWVFQFAVAVLGPFIVMPPL
jgi:hypothetical protein